MSILIKGMEMPNSCWRCPLCLTVDPDTYRCMVTGDNFPATFDAIDHIVLPCPLVEIPPHGRLIDADALIDALPAWTGHNDKISRLAAIRDSIFLIDDAPTIIDAEGGET